MEKKIIVGKPADDFIRIQDLWGMFVSRWHWFCLLYTSPSPRD